MVAMQRDSKKEKKQLQPWQIQLQANPNSFYFYFNFNFNFRPTIIPFFLSNLSSSSPINFTLSVNNFDPQPQPIIKRPNKTIRSKFLNIFRKLRFRSAKNAVFSGKETRDVTCSRVHSPANRAMFLANEEKKLIGSNVIGFISLLSQSVQRDQMRFILYSSIIFLCLAINFNFLIRNKKCGALMSVTISIMNIVIVGVYLSHVMRIVREGYLLDHFWAALKYVWKYAPLSSG